VRGAHPTGMSLSGAFYARSSGNWWAERTFVICRMHFMHAVAASGARSAPYGYVIGRVHFMHAVAAIGGRSAPLLFVGCILCMQ
jgi:hypothetical protein